MQTVISQTAEAAFLDKYPIVLSTTFQTSNTSSEQNSVVDNLNELGRICHEAAAYRGWWHTASPTYDVIDGSVTGADVYELKERNVGELIALMHSELSEALEAARRNLQSDHIPEFTGIEEELADCLIRIFDFACAAQLRLGEAFVAKMKFNVEREDHKMSERMKEGGKKI